MIVSDRIVFGSIGRILSKLVYLFKCQENVLLQLWKKTAFGYDVKILKKIFLDQGIAFLLLKDSWLLFLEIVHFYDPVQPRI